MDFSCNDLIFGSFSCKQENCVSDNGNFTENWEFSVLSYEIFISQISTPSTEANVSPTGVPLALEVFQRHNIQIHSPSAQVLVPHLDQC